MNTKIKNCIQETPYEAKEDRQASCASLNTLKNQLLTILKDELEVEKEFNYEDL